MNTSHDCLAFLLAGLILPVLGAGILGGNIVPLTLWVVAFLLLIISNPRRNP